MEECTWHIDQKDWRYILCYEKDKTEPKSVQMVYPSLNKAPNIILVEGHKDGGAFLKWEEPIYVHNEDGSYTEKIDRIYGRVK